ncbi:DUF6382 domain-containing protein [Clostridium sp.]|uniref:DUF6382 domain-containing protein n=1 Tax=Clostridium sp. TaxID=1506 RepID=UPI0025BC1DA1|nr:DUF6382 domain-containing protein [Clostridium sp.]
MKSKQNLNFNIENINNKRYCTLSVNEDEVLLEYEINMIKNNPSLPFLEIDIVQVNSDKKVLYKLCNKISLSEIIQDDRYDIEKVIEILENIYKCANNMKEFMLDNRKMVLDYKNIYVNSDLVPYMIYLPFKNEELNDIKENLIDLFENIIKVLKGNKNNLTNNDKKMLSKMTKNRIKLDEFGQLFTEYKMKKDEERLLDKPSKIKEEEDIISERAYHISNQDSNYRQQIKEETKDVEKRRFKSIIEEDYSEFQDVDNEEDIEDYLESQLEYEEYKDIHQYDKKMDSRQKDKKIIIIQLIVLMMIGSLGLIISYDDKKLFIGIAVGMLVVIIIFTALIISNNKSKE